MAATISGHFFRLFASVTNDPCFPSSRFLFSITNSKRISISFWTTNGTDLNCAVFVFHFSRVFSPSDVDGGSGNFPKNSDYHDRSRLTTPSCDRSRGNLLLERDEWFNGERRSSVERALFDILSSDCSTPLTPRLLVA
ncbi:hypothetical protein DPMN_109160 [Dreissena polymorpha]|uniref:Uncharacterized protein n=1 Tax=Dreissena polymorpha TaxID=45954 RepID=A0A9D4KAK8_DREPO|nr:hypothetical protein DPMN_109160 [Dreissena polymorpha]